MPVSTSFSRVPRQANERTAYSVAAQFLEEGKRSLIHRDLVVALTQAGWKLRFSCEQ